MAGGVCFHNWHFCAAVRTKLARLRSHQGSVLPWLGSLLGATAYHAPFSCRRGLCLPPGQEEVASLFAVHSNALRFCVDSFVRHPCCQGLAHSEPIFRCWRCAVLWRTRLFSVAAHAVRTVRPSQP